MVEPPNPQNERDEGRDDDVTRALRDNAPGSTVAEQHALAGLRQRLFGRDQTPLTLSRYVLTGRLGAGGVGVVYEARDPELDRKVAIKLVVSRGRDGVDPSEAQARLLREAQSLARLSHPNVVPVHDVGSYEERDLDLPPGERFGSDGGEPGRGVFIVMELVDGQNLREWLADRPRPWREVIEVFAASGRGLAAAHREGLIHRDFKPANVIVGTDGRARVLDFGLARNVGETLESADLITAQTSPDDPDATPKLFQTRTGTVMGTPAYMAPEQHRGDAVDSRTDQFAFCVALFEGLYGVRPFKGQDIDALAKAKAAGQIRAPADVSVPSRIHAALVRGLSADPDDRFPTMDALVQTLTRDPTTGRRRRILATVAGVSLLGASALGVVAWQQHRRGACLGQDRLLVGVWDKDAKGRVQSAFTTTGLPYADRTWASVNANLDAYANRWVEMRTQTCEATLVRREVPRATMDGVVMCLDGRLRALSEVVAVFGDATPSVVQNAQAVVAGLPPLDACLGETAVPEDPAARERRLAIEGHLTRANSLMEAGRYADALSDANRAIELAREAGDPPTVARSLLAAGLVETFAHRHDQAEELLFESLEVAESCDDHEIAVQALTGLVRSITILQSRAKEGDRLARLAAVKLEKHPFDPRIEADYFLQTGRLRMSQGRYDQAIPLYERALELRGERGEPDGEFVIRPGDRAAIADTYNSLAIAVFRAGDREKGRELFRRALEIYRTELGDQHPRVAMMLSNVAETTEPHSEKRIQMEREALAIRRATLRPAHPHIASSIHNLGTYLARLGRHEEALAQFREAGQVFVADLGPGNPEMPAVLAHASNALRKLGRHDEALADARRSVEVAESSFGKTHPRLGVSLLALGWAQLALEDFDGAEQAFARHVKLVETPFGPSHPDLAEPLRGLGTVHFRQGDADAAAPFLERAVSIGQSSNDDAIELAAARFALAQSLVQADPMRAVEVARKAESVYADLAGMEAERAAVRRWLRDHTPG